MLYTLEIQCLIISTQNSLFVFSDNCHSLPFIVLFMYLPPQGDQILQKNIEFIFVYATVLEQYDFT